MKKKRKPLHESRKPGTIRSISYNLYLELGARRGVPRTRGKREGAKKPLSLLLFGLAGNKGGDRRIHYYLGVNKNY